MMNEHLFHVIKLIVTTGSLNLLGLYALHFFNKFKNKNSLIDPQVVDFSVTGGTIGAIVVTTIIAGIIGLLC